MLPMGDSLMTRSICFASMLALFTFLGVCQIDAQTPAEIIASFTSQDDDSAWMQGRPYMRRLEDDTWKTRMRAMQKLVEIGKAAVPALLEATNAKEDSTRIFATQTLGYLAAHAPRERLLQLARKDPNAAVRLYAVDAIGMQGGPEPTAELSALKKKQKNRDVLKHIGYALERDGQGIEEDVVERLARFDPTRIDTAVLGKAAPDFELTTPDDKTVRLSDFRGKQAVVLVFVYGDT